MTIQKDYDFYDLVKDCWSGAKDTLATIEQNNKENELMWLLEECFVDRIPTLTEVNDMLWFDDDFICENLGIDID